MMVASAGCISASARISQHGLCSLVHRIPHGVQIETGIDRGGLLALVPERFPDDVAIRAGRGLVAAERAAQVVNAQILNPGFDQDAAPRFLRVR